MEASYLKSNREGILRDTGGYDSVETIRLLEGIFDIYMPDFKFWDQARADRFCAAPRRRESVTFALKEMHRQVGVLKTDANGIARKGLLVRHLVMPGGIAGTAEIMRFIGEELSPDTYVNIMDQYRPCGRAARDPLINRRITTDEYRDALEAAKSAELRRGSEF
jgi:putative pyruvate formate lyase activating enzyme